VVDGAHLGATLSVAVGTVTTGGNATLLQWSIDNTLCRSRHSQAEDGVAEKKKSDRELHGSSLGIEG
jgi:hypothetical protein